MPIRSNWTGEGDDRHIDALHSGDAGTPAGQTPADPVVIPRVPPVTTAPPPTVGVPGKVKPTVDAARKAGQPKNTTRNVLLGAGAIAIVAAVMFIMRPSASHVQMNAAAAKASAAAAAPRHTVVPVAESASTAAPKWKRTQQSRWAPDGSATMGFEVGAERDVAVFMDRVRPTLSVRCIARETEVFVVLHSAASIESAGDTHTVKISLDGEPDVEQQWLDSIDKQALFAPDGKALAARLVASRRLRFSFKPFNAAPATVEFDVHGFDEPLAAMSKTCNSPVNRRPVRRG
jgi:Type VI secretion system VasI, EvfG, VC_A0118